MSGIRESRTQAVYQLPWNAIHRVALLPGSRPQEIERMLPVMLSAAAILEHRIVDCGFLIASAGGKQEQCILDILAAHPVKPGCLSVITDHTRDIVTQADAAMVCSGTATLETALLNCPMVVCYKAHPLAFKLIRPLIRVPYIGMVNIIAGREICPELLQNKATPEALAETIADLVRPGVRRLDMLHDLKEVQSRIGNGGAARNAAGVISDMLGHPTLTENDFRWF